jgi:hypothetical protein
MKTFTIDTKHWLRGGNLKGNSTLCNESGNMCCLGHLAKACGAKKQDIFNHASPKHTIKVNWPEGLLDSSFNHTELCKEIIIVNDDFELKPAVRKRTLRQLFSQIGYRPVFK